jgi:hypothetical protein
MIPESFKKLVGMWDGTKRLMMAPEDPIRDCDAVACVGLEANEKFFKINYEWSFGGEKQEGLTVIHIDKESNAKSVWIDSFHQSGDFMNCAGKFEQERVSVKANYTQPEYSDWAWRTIIEPHDEDAFSLLMFNITPDGEEFPAVEAKFTRRK